MKNSIYLVLLVLSACSYRIEKEADGSNLSTANIGFAEVQAAVFAPKCARCHGWATGAYEAVVPLITEMNARLQSTGANMMPPSNASPLTAGEKALVLGWISKGAPQMGGGQPQTPPANPPPAGPGAPVPPPPANAILGFEEIKAFVFAPKCLRCHSGMMASYESLQPKFTEIQRRISIRPGDALEFDMMPPSRATALSPEEKAALDKWFQDGAPKFGSAQPGQPNPGNPPPAPPVDPCRTLTEERRGGGHDDPCDDTLTNEGEIR